ncbi:hypothetical protein C2845_PM15G16250 [Panicum miliaceum]|uniref:Cyclin n=1 Tax=Panicum miliaceum TaxID=4540 RepID=A0A3L6QAX1_PANMI|nr:hypothetical protein C2845_PM15G16250 [Panicum miliaceum]
MAEEEQLADAPRVVGVLSALLERVVERNDAAADELAAGDAPASAASLAPASAFRATARPDISVRSYMARIARFAGCSPACYVVAYVYLDRLLRRGRRGRGRAALAVDSYSVHRLLITAVLAAVKFMDDVCYNNAYFARVGGISLAEMNYLEVDFLFAVGFDLNVSPETFGHYCAVLQAEMLRLELDKTPPTTTMTPAAAAGPRLHSCCLSEDDGAASSSSGSSQQQLAA